ncbi:MAG: hypothetical protein Q4B04_02815 [bacterium]|nr:hypothetical protein [bacterium]
MKKMIIYAVFAVIFASLFSLNVSAQDDSIYKNQYNSSGAEELYDNLTDDAKDLIDDLGISPESYDWQKTLTSENVFELIADLIKNGAREPFGACGVMIIMMVVASVVNGVFFEKNNQISGVMTYITLICVTLSVIIPFVKSIKAVIAAIKGCSNFVLGFLPVYTGVLASMGKPATAAASSSVMLVVCQVVTQLAGNFILPIISIYLALNIANVSGGMLKTVKLSETLKSVAIWGLSFLMTVFLGVMSIQTTISAAADSAGMRTAKFVVSSTVPIVGVAVSEAISTVGGCLKLLSTTTGMFAVLSVVIIFLPVLCQLLIWKLSVFLLCSFAQLLDEKDIESVTAAINSTISMIIGIILCIGIMFIVSLTIIISVGGR